MVPMINSLAIVLICTFVSQVVDNDDHEGDCIGIVEQIKRIEWLIDLF
jgi:hypothetical protein